jgi:hypothetical protein
VGNRTIAVASFALIALFGVLAWASSSAPPARADQLVGLSLACLSLGVALLAFGFLRGQTAGIRYRAAGMAINIGGALAAGIILFGALLFGIRGTSNLEIELYADSQFTKPWKVPVGAASPEFAVSLASYTVVTKPDDFVVRFHNLPIFERVRFYSRDIRWTVTKLTTSDNSCRASGISLSGWCNSAQAVVINSNCLDQWTGSGTVAGKSIGQAIDYLVGEMHKVNYPARKLSALGKDTLGAIDLPIQPTTTFYSKSDFCAAIDPYKVALEQKLKVRVKIALSCDTIGIAVGDEKLPDPPGEQGWKLPC